MNSWRSNDWEREAWNHTRGSPEARAYYEAGAHAILEELKKDGQYVHNRGTMPYGLVLSRTLKLGEKGWLVFIPDRS